MSGNLQVQGSAAEAVVSAVEREIEELRDVVMRARVILVELIEANPPADVARELSIVDELDRVLNRRPRP